MTEHHTTEPRYTPPRGSIPTLDVPSLEGVSRLHLIGIGGAGMRNLAKLLLARGITVSGSDLKDSKGLAELRDEAKSFSLRTGRQRPHRRKRPPNSWQES